MFHFSGLVYSGEEVVGYRCANPTRNWKQEIEFANAILKSVDVEKTVTHLAGIFETDLECVKVEATIQNGDVIFSDGDYFNPSEFAYINFYF